MNPDLDAARFEALWRRRIPSPPAATAGAVHADLCRRLGGPDRRFHNLNHIGDCLNRFDRVAPLLANPDAVELAIWFHDAVYVPGDAGNERRSTELFLSYSDGADRLFRRRVCALILTTRHQRQAPEGDRGFIEDIDLAGFGGPWEEFMRQGDLLREEFAAQPDAQYYAGQVWFLGFLKRRRWFFSTKYFRERYEAQAQENLDRLLGLLAAQGYRPAPG